MTTTLHTTDVVDLFGGPGGFDLGARAIGIDALGIEWDDATCSTRAAAGLRTIQADVAALEPADFAPCTGLIASSPCPGFSSAGKGKGRADMPLIVEASRQLVAGRDTRGELRARCQDERSPLVVEPLRWALELRPRWIVLEQVPAVLPLWQLFAELLTALGYGTWAGVLHAEQFGVPQTRKRAFLLARPGEPVSAPEPTHTRYAKGKPRQADGLLPWVSMADALGWGMTARPYPTIACSRSTGGPDKEKVGGSAARATIYGERDAGRWIPQQLVDTGNTRGGTRTEGRSRETGEPAPTITSRADQLEWREHDWPHERPAPTVTTGTARVKGGVLLYPEWRGEETGERNPVRVTAAEAAVLQSFPADYPWQGNKTKTFQQIGNAVPPLMAEAVLGAVATTELEAAA